MLDSCIQNKIDRQIGECPFGNLNKEATRKWLTVLWELVLVDDVIDVPDDIEILGVNPTFKLVYADKSPIKAFLTTESVWNFICVLFEALIPVCTPLYHVQSNAEDQASFWCFVSWIDGVCNRSHALNIQYIQQIPETVWHNLGSVLACIHSIPANESLYYLTSTDIGWWNYVIDNEDNIWLIDPKKVQVEEFPEKWIYLHICFNKYITIEQKVAFITGYSSVRLKKRSETGMEILLAAKKFTDMLYEKLAK